MPVSRKHHSFSGRAGVLGLAVMVSGVLWAQSATVTYVYDDAGRLRSADTTDGTHADYQYDPAGNRTGVNLVASAGAGILALTSSTWSVEENVAGGVLVVKVSRLGGATGAASVVCSAASGTAIAATDFTNPAATLSWSAGTSGTKNCSIPITNDVAFEGNETFSVTLTSASGASLGAPSAATVTIIDNETAPTGGAVKFTVSTATVSETVAGGVLALSVSRVDGSYGAASVICSANSGTATAGSDFTNPGATLSWANGDAANKTCSVPILNDSLYEPNETFTVALSGASGTSLGAPSSVAVTLTSDDAQPPAGNLQFTASSASASESATNIILSVSRSGGTYGAASVVCATANGTAQSGSDYTSVNETLTWGDGDAANKSCTIPLVNDSSYELTETFTAALSGATGATLGSPSSATLTINDDDPQPPAGTLQLTQTAWSVAENVAGGTIGVTVSRVGGTFGAASVLCSAASGNATVGVDFTNPSQTLTWTNGEAASKTCTISITNDSTWEGDETFQVNLSGASGAALGTPASATVTITNDDPEPVPGTLSFSPVSYSVLENVGVLHVLVARTGGVDGAVSVTGAAIGGTATGGNDYSYSSYGLTWANGEGGSKPLGVNVVDDAVFESAETIVFQLSGPTGGASIGGSTATVTINDNEPGVVSLNPRNQTVSEGAGSITITVERVLGTYGAVSVAYSTSNGTAVAGSDFTQTSGTLHWADGQSNTQTFVVPIINDSTGETDEAFEIVLSNGTGGVGVGVPGTITITDNDSSLPTTPTGLASNDPPPVTDGGYIVSWNASTGGVSYYELQEGDAFFSSPITFTQSTLSKQFTGKPSGDYYYRVRACNASNQCSAYTAPLYVLVCDGACQ